MTWQDRLGAVGVWRGATDTDPALAAQAERLGYGTLWLGGSPPADLHAAERLLEATDALVVATGITNIWMTDPAELADAYHRVEARFPGRLLLGIGSGHREATPQRVRPLEAMSRYLDVLDERGVPASARVLSALGPKMLAMSAARAVGTHPYLTVPSQSEQMRQALGEGVLVAPEQTVVLQDDSTDEAAARTAARDFLSRYLQLDNYTSTMHRGGFTEADTALPGSDRLVDAIVVHGDAAALAAGVRAHLDAGADHVCVQVVPAGSDVAGALGALAGALGLTPRG
ncbi:TIGR03620 family F420-dependent LLM class oxidoreductase [Quadrisphaera oryzae]|uniref:TIGR03620 family F420-dependent LLM class oxidoreductase n=1 Tax=Quadrisphaera TaxID=317661 RepID=UPI001647E1CB|nr:TIGR03620 family F420-dependent LLM class oxidoreductase [Quadrisphaera sp. RL12-1S]MBC3761281.1 TIGR03620 family F420-dependent LLM class oxidoreductase [Quadrisphaera sp. RL12-1S]